MEDLWPQRTNKIQILFGYGTFKDSVWIQSWSKSKKLLIFNGVQRLQL